VKTRHHLLAQSRGGKSENNVMRLTFKCHKWWHDVFGVLTPTEAVIFLKLVFVPGGVYTSDDLAIIRRFIVFGKVIDEPDEWSLGSREHLVLHYIVSASRGGAEKNNSVRVPHEVSEGWRGMFKDLLPSEVVAFIREVFVPGSDWSGEDLARIRDRIKFEERRRREETSPNTRSNNQSRKPEKGENRCQTRFEG